MSTDWSYEGRGAHGDLVQALALSIVNGAYPAGHQLDLEGLGARAKVSRTVVREALKVLESKGLVDARPKRGTRVRDRSEWNLLDPDLIYWLREAEVEDEFLDELSTLREAVEPIAARLAAIRQDEAGKDGLKAAFARLEEAVIEWSVEEIVDADVLFHVSILEASGNRFFRQMTPLLATALSSRDRLVLQEPTKQSPTGQMVDDHRAVMRAIVDGKPELAERRMRALVEAAGIDARGVKKKKKPAARRTARR